MIGSGSGSESGSDCGVVGVGVGVICYITSTFSYGSDVIGSDVITSLP